MAQLGTVARALGSYRPPLVDASRPVEQVAAMRRRARALAHQVGAGDRYLNAIAQRQSGVDFQRANAEQLKAVIAAIYHYVRRRHTR